MRRMITTVMAGLLLFGAHDVQAFDEKAGIALWGKASIKTCRSCHKEKGLSSLAPLEKSKAEWDSFFADDRKHNFSAIGINERQLQNIHRYLVEESSTRRMNFDSEKLTEKIAESSVVNGTDSSTSKSSTQKNTSPCKELATSAWEGNYEQVNSLLKSGVDPNCEYKGKSILMYASKFGRAYKWDQNIDVVKLLVKAGANIHFENKESGETYTPTYMAAYNGHTKTAIYLVRQGGSADDAERGYRNNAAANAGSLAALGLIAKAAEAYLTCDDCPPSSNGNISSGSNKSISESSATSSNNKTRSNKKHNNGVKKYYDGGYKSSDGSVIYIVKCNSDEEYSAFQKNNGYWFDGTGFNYGDRFKNLSISGFAEKKCSN